MDAWTTDLAVVASAARGVGNGVPGPRAARGPPRRGPGGARPGEAAGLARDPAGARERARLQRPADRGAVAASRPRRPPTRSRSTWASSARRSSPSGRAGASGRAPRSPAPPGTCFASRPTSSTPTASRRCSARGGRRPRARRPRRPRSQALQRRRSSLWRGPRARRLRLRPFAQAEIARLEELRLDAIEDRMEADLGLGGAADLVGELETLISDNPLRERLRGQLMLALYRAGRQADALEVYNDTRTDPRRGARPRAEPAATAPAGRDPPPGAGARGLDRDAGRPEPQPPAPDAAAPEVRKTVTVLIARRPSVRGLGPRGAQPRGQALPRAPRRGPWSATAEAIASSLGDEVMAVFGVPHAHEDDAFRAVAAAFEIRDAPVGDAIASGTRPRVGIATGEVLASGSGAGASP